ncbi:MAG: hypothetical protein U0235_13875 [Polyangiaceae bacterium]
MLLSFRMLRPLLTVLVTTTLVVGIAGESRGDNAADLTSDQQTARDEFLEDVKEELDEVNQKCGVAITLSTDFQNYDPSLDAEGKDDGPKKKGGPGHSRKARMLRAIQCRTLLEALAADCVRAKTPVRSVACLFAGHKPYKNRENREDFARRNIEWDASTGRLTLHQGSGSAIDDDAMKHVVAVTTRPDIDHGRFNGMKCSTDEQCESHLCSSGKCVNCYKGPKCHDGNVCWGGMRGVCNPPYYGSASDDDAPSASSSRGGGSRGGGSSKPKLGSGAKCRFSSECASGRCKAIGGGKSACT